MSVFVKICGTTTEEDALLSVALGADAVGFIFAPSPRQITVEAASDIIKRLPHEIVPVGVFRNTPTSRILEQVVASGVRAVQLHGMETPAEVAMVKKKLPIPVWKAVDATKEDLSRIERYHADVILVDGPNPGSGKRFPWERLATMPQAVPMMLAGGLRPDNVAEAITRLRPWGIDVVSGVESAPGKKDPVKLHEFIANARAAHEPVSQEAIVIADREDSSGDAAVATPFYDWEKD